jgi:competence protein ComEC
MEQSGPGIMKELPFLRILIPFAAGITTRLIYPVGNVFPAAMMAISLALILSFRFLPIWAVWRYAAIRAIALHAVLFAAGCFIMAARDLADHRQQSLKEEGEEPMGYIMTLLQPTEKKPRSHRSITKTWRVMADGEMLPIQRCIVYFKKDDSLQVPKIGDRIFVFKDPSPLKSSDNPGGFNPSVFYGRQGIGGSVYLQKGDYLIISGKEKMLAARMIFKTRDSILGILRTHLRDPAAAGLAEALLIGYRNDLDADISDAYANTGVIHVIAISGLHIGMLYAIFMWLTGPLNRSGRTAWLQLLIVLPCIWFFSLMTGAGASVMRSTCMFTLLGIGKLLMGRRGHPLNTLSATAFLLLSYQPYWIADIGFQLSFSAVASIMIFYDRVKNFLIFYNPVAEKLWEMVAITLAAQILTTPVILLYFGQFPVFFLLTNLVAIPLSSLILLGEIILCAFSFSPLIATNIGSVLELGSHWMNGYVFRMDAVPFSVIRDIHMTIPGIILLYGCILCATKWISGHAMHWTLGLITCSALFSIESVIDTRKTEKQRILVVMHASDDRLIMLVNGRGSVTYAGQNENTRSRITRQNIAATERFYHIEHREKHSLPDSSAVSLKWQGLNLIILNGNDAAGESEKIIPADLIILSGNTTADIEHWHKTTACKVWVADGTNSMWKILKWKKEAERLHLQFHSTSMSGAYIQRI